MKKFIKFTIIILMITIILLICIIGLFKKKEEKSIYEGEGKSNYITIDNPCIIKKVDDRNMFFAVKNIVKAYLTAIGTNDKAKLMNFISNNYIKENKINVNNVLSNVPDESIEYTDNYEFIINKIYFSEENDLINTYFMEMFYYNLNNKKKYETRLMVQLDPVNMTFQVIPYKYMKEKGYDKLNIGDSYSATVKEVANKKDNTYKMVPIPKNTMADRYFSTYQEYLKNDKEASYYLLNKEYREKRFENINKYLEYIKKADLENAVISKSQSYDRDEYTEYVCIDIEGRYYIFNESGVMDYSIMLDTYTLDLPEFLEKYNSTNEQGKVVLNIQKFIDAINSYDYNYAYNCLSTGFKTNYFKTVQDFEKYIESTLYAKNEVSYESFEEQSGLYKYKVKITNKENQTESTTKTFIVKLNDGTDFEMSFNVD